MSDSQPQTQSQSQSTVNAQPPPAKSDSQANGGQGQNGSSTEPEEGYPPQLHAGAVGLGPEYGKGASGGDKLTGWKEEIAGKIMRNPEKVQHGKDMRTGELKKKEKDDDSNNPFANAGDKKDKKDKRESEDQDKSKSDSSQPQSQTNADINTSSPDPRTQNADKQMGAAPPSVEAQTGPNEKAAKEQAATTAPEGTSEAEIQRKGENTHADKQIG